MQRFILKTLGFIGICILLYPILVFIWGMSMHPRLHPNLQYLKGAYGHEYTRIREARKTHDVDVLVLGSSHAYRGFDPRIFKEHGIKMFNLGSSAQSHLQTQVLLKRYLNQLNPKVVIYEVYPYVFWSDGVESALDIIANDKVDLYTAKMALKMNHLKIYNALFCSFFVQKFGIDQDFKEPKKIEYDTYISGGYVQRDMAYNELDSASAFSWKVRPKQMKAFEKNLELIRASGAKVLLVMAPVTETRYSSARNNQWFDSTMAAHGTFIDFNGEIPLVDTLHFYDQHHLNQKGVEIFNEEVIERLKDGGLEKD